MAKVLRLHDGIHAAGDNIEGWGSSLVIGDKAIDSIIDPQNNSSRNEITSIPSPFARMDLVKQAFKYVNEKKLVSNDSEDSMYLKLVSDCLDVAEIFFNIDKYLGEKLEISVWDSNEIQKLKDTPNNSQEKLLGETLSLFIDADRRNGNVYNLANMSEIFILKYVGPGAPETSALGEHVIGATSPCTMFFTPAGDLSYVTDQILFEGNDRPFDGDFNPLCNRDREFIKYMVWLKTQDGFVNTYPDVAQYITDTVTYCASKDPIFGQELRTITSNTSLDIEQVVLDNGLPITLAGGFPVMQKLTVTSNIQKTSQFVIKPTKQVSGGLPLVLPLDLSCKGLIYTITEWDGSLASMVPCNDPLPLNQRLLPGLNIPYPYLTMGDFLEATLIQTNFSQQSFVDDGRDSDFFTLGSAKEKLDTYLIPVKKEYFNYFSMNDLKQNLKAKKGPQGEVIVTLSIPIVGNRGVKSVSYQRIYTTNVPRNTRKFGKIIDINATGVTVFPHTKFAGNEDYRVTLYIARKLTEELPVTELPTLNLVNTEIANNPTVTTEIPVCRNQDSNGTIADRNTIVSKTWEIKSAFDIIELMFDGVKNLIIPILKLSTGPKKFSFAVDFGTTNSHVEYSVDGSEPKALDTTDADAQIRPSIGMFRHAPCTKIQIGDLMPVRLGETSDISFPIRTALTYIKRTDWDKRVIPLAQANIPFYYERKSQPEYNEDPKTNLKWSKDSAAQAQTECFISNLAFIMRNKVLMNGGDLSQTNIVWFYPTSMPTRVIGDLERTWNKVYDEYFHGDSRNVTSLPEAVAPLSYYKNATTDALTIDIGGGTSDFLFACDKRVEYISSARFASNSLFGDGLTGVNMSNGFVNHFYPIIQDKLENYPELKGILENIQSGANTSSNLASYFFSLKSNAAIKDDKEREILDFTRMLADSSESSSVILLFYMALIYYAARIIKAKGMKEPRYIGFSGNGSKVLDIFFSNSVSKDCVIDITKGIFEEVLGHPYDSDGLDILQPRGKSPKEATAKGGLEILKKNEGANYNARFVDKHALVLLGTREDDVVEMGSRYRKNSDVDDSAFDSVVKSVEDFVNISKRVLEKENAPRYINMVEINKLFSNQAFTRDLTKYIKDGRSNEGIKEEDEISTTLFFYPIEGILHKLAIDLLK